MKTVEQPRPYFEIANLEIPKILERLPKGLRVLDVGCGSGVHGAELKRIHSHSVVGVDLSTASIEKAAKRLDAAHVADVTKPREYPFAATERFDVLLFSDILEHLMDPSEVLARHLFLLKPGGHMLVSLPNVAIWNVRFQMLFGSFRYRETGTLDKTHLRFFTWRTASDMFDDVGLAVKNRRTTPGIVRPFVPLVKQLYARAGAIQNEVDSSSIMDSKPYRLYCRFLYPIESLLCRLCPGLLAFQYVSLCQPLLAASPAETLEQEGEYAQAAKVRTGSAPYIARGTLYEMPDFKKLVARLKRQYGEPALPPAKGPFELVMWENACYLLPDTRRAQVFESLRREVGLNAQAIWNADQAALLPLAEMGGMRPEVRVFRWREIARITITQFGGDLDRILKEPYAKAKRSLKQFPSIGDPGAEKILLFCGMGPGLPLESNGVRVLTRIGYGRVEKNYGATYRSVQEALIGQLPRDAQSLSRAHLLLREHGKTLCKTNAPLCEKCPVSDGCTYANSVRY